MYESQQTAGDSIAGRRPSLEDCNRCWLVWINSNYSFRQVDYSCVLSSCMVWRVRLLRKVQLDRAISLPIVINYKTEMGGSVLACIGCRSVIIELWRGGGLWAEPIIENECFCKEILKRKAWFYYANFHFVTVDSNTFYKRFVWIVKKIQSSLLTGFEARALVEHLIKKILHIYFSFERL